MGREGGKEERRQAKRIVYSTDNPHCSLYEDLILVLSVPPLLLWYVCLHSCRNGLPKTFLDSSSTHLSPGSPERRLCECCGEGSSLSDSLCRDGGSRGRQLVTSSPGKQCCSLLALQTPRHLRVNLDDEN